MGAIKLTDHADNCGDLVIQGWSNAGWVTCVDEIKKMNRSKRDMAAAGAVSVPGQLFEVGEAVDFTGASVGSGYWRKMSVVIDMSDFEGTWKNNNGSVGFDQKFKFTAGGTSTATLEWLINLMTCCGLSMIAVDKNGNYWELGNKLSPAKLDSAKIKKNKDGDHCEGELHVTYPPRKYDAVAFPIDEIPN